MGINLKVLSLKIRQVLLKVFLCQLKRAGTVSRSLICQVNLQALVM